MFKSIDTIEEHHIVKYIIVDDDFKREIVKTGKIIYKSTAIEKVYQNNKFAANFIRYIKFWIKYCDLTYGKNNWTFDRALEHNMRFLINQDLKKQLEKYLVLL
jgi:hypothetical protein